MTGAPKPVGHDSRPHCGALKRDGSGTTCRRPAGWGTPAQTGRCKLHGGNSHTHRKAADREQLRQAVATYGVPREIPADIGLLEEVHRTAGHVQALAHMVADLGREELAWGIAEQTTRRITLRDPDSFDSGGDEGDGSVQGSVIDTKRKAVPHVLVTMYRDERRHLVEVCKTVAGLDIEERRESRAERQAEQFATVLRLLLVELALTPAQQDRVPAALAMAVAALSAEPAA